MCFTVQPLWLWHSHLLWMVGMVGVLVSSSCSDLQKTSGRRHAARSFAAACCRDESLHVFPALVFDTRCFVCPRSSHLLLLPQALCW